jgi:hypothetical protein
VILREYLSSFGAWYMIVLGAVAFARSLAKAADVDAGNFSK